MINYVIIYDEFLYVLLLVESWMFLMRHVKIFYPIRLTVNQTINPQQKWSKFEKNTHRKTTNEALCMCNTFKTIRNIVNKKIKIKTEHVSPTMQTPFVFYVNQTPVGHTWPTIVQRWAEVNRKKS